jgi:hypothetical protein
MPPSLIQQLESLSGYRHLFPPQDSKASLNPVVFSHLALTVAGRRCHVLSRICNAGISYTQRANMCAHHVVLDMAEAPAAGPAWLLAQAGFMRRQWTGEPSILPTGPVIPMGESEPRVCSAWQRLTGDAGWSGVLAETAAGSNGRQAIIVFPPDVDMLPLLAETLALLPAEVRWRTSFSTYFTKLPAGVSCQWRCVVDGTPEAVAARRTPQSAVVLDLCRSLGRARFSVCVEAAREGTTPSIPPTTEHLPVAEVGHELRGNRTTPVAEGNAQPMPAAAGPPGYAVPPPVSSQAHWQPPVPPLNPKRKRRAIWPWLLAAAAIVLIILGGGIFAWTLRFPGDQRTEVAQKEVQTDEHGAERENKRSERARPKVDKKAEQADFQKNTGPQEIKGDKGTGVPGTVTNGEKKGAEATGLTGPKKVAQAAEVPKLEKPKPKKDDPPRNLRDKAIDLERYKYVSQVGIDPKAKPALRVSLPTNVAQCDVSLVTAPEMFPDKWKLHPLTFSSSVKSASCFLERPAGMGSLNRKEPLQLATFGIQDGELLVRWASVKRENEELANLLRNCPLKIATQDCREAVVYLRKPSRVSPIKLNRLSQVSNLPTPHEGLKDVPKGIRAELEILRPYPDGTRPPTQDSTTQVWSLRADTDTDLSFRLNLEVRHRDNGTHIVVVLVDRGVRLDTKVFGCSVAKHVNSLENKKTDKEKLLKDSHVNDSDREKLRTDINELGKNIEEAKKIKQLYERIGNSELHYRVYLPVDKYKVELITSEQEEPGPK